MSQHGDARAHLFHAGRARGLESPESPGRFRSSSLSSSSTLARCCTLATSASGIGARQSARRMVFDEHARRALHFVAGRGSRYSPDCWPAIRSAEAPRGAPQNHGQHERAAHLSSTRPVSSVVRSTDGIEAAPRCARRPPSWLDSVARSFSCSAIAREVPAAPHQGLRVLHVGGAVRIARGNFQFRGDFHSSA